MGRWRLLDNPDHERIADTLDELEGRLEDVEHEASTPLVPNHDHTAMNESINALQRDLADVQRQALEAPSQALVHLGPLEERISAIEQRLSSEERSREHSVESEAEHAIDTSKEVSDDVIDIPAEVVEPKRRHILHDFPRWL